jgi:peptidoglycan/LPS O-acetylase OafA/YrhL
MWDEFVSSNLEFISIMAPPLFLSESWDIWVEPPWNGPYWSLCYEAWYYVIFGLFFFAKRTTTGLVLGGIAALIAGPRILALFPIWILGALLARHGLRFQSRPAIGCAILIGSIAAIILIDEVHLRETVGGWLYSNIPGWWRLGASQHLFTDFMLAVLVAANFIGFRMAESWLSPLIMRFESPIQFFAGFTFSIYLFHRPITNFLAHIGLTDLPSLFALLLVVSAILVACMGLGQFTEKRRDIVRRVVARLLSASKKALGVALGSASAAAK